MDLVIFMEKIDEILSALDTISNKLNEASISWGLGGSLLLFYYNIVDVVNDIDIIVDINDLEKLYIVLSNFEYNKIEKSGNYITEHFFEVKINNVDIDIMLNFAIVKEDMTFVYPFNKDELIETKMKNSTIYLLLLKDWLEAYKIMGRTKKVKLLERFISNSEV